MLTKDETRVLLEESLIEIRDLNQIIETQLIFLKQAHAENEQLVKRIESLNRATDDIIEIYRNQIKEMDENCDCPP